MAENYFGELTDDEDFIEGINLIINENQRKPQVYRERSNHFVKWNDEEFKDRFRLPKPIVHFISNKISDKIQNQLERNSIRNHTLTPVEMVLVCLRYLATGSILLVVGDFNGIHKSTASRCIRKVVEAIARLRPEFIKMPGTLEEINSIKQGFFNISKFPKCIGAIDCTHVKIQSPGGNDAELYRNRKGFFSINVQAVCDADLVIQNIVCRWQGSAHDSSIFRNSRLRRRFENNDFPNCLLVGDSGYPIKNYLITPLNNPQADHEKLFNEAQIRTRNPIERCFGVLKRRFPVLALGIKLKLDRVPAIITACVVLHNIACKIKDQQPFVNAELESAIEFTQNVNLNFPARENRRTDQIIRHSLINEYFINM